jgi:radical SAM superfamily enzyme YgiQ (UPF0313 family)
MLTHPLKQVFLNSEISSGKYVVKLYRRKNIAVWNTKGYAVFMFRALSGNEHVNQLVKDYPELTVFFTDDVERFEETVPPKFSRVKAYRKIITGNTVFQMDMFACLLEKTGTPSELDGCHDRVNVALLDLQNRKDVRWRSIGIPVSAHVLMAALQKRGCHVRYHAVYAEDMNVNFLSNFDCAAIGVYEDSAVEMFELIQKIREYTSIPVILGGPMITLAGEIAAAHFAADAYLRGEAEETIGKLVTQMVQLQRGSSISRLYDLSRIKGLFATGSNWGVSADFNTTPTTDDFSAVELAYDQLDEKDLYAGLEYSSSRGCPRSCIFCSHVHGKMLRCYPDNLVRKHLRRVKTEVKKRTDISGLEENNEFVLNLNDDDLLLDRDRSIRILEVIRDEGFKICGIQTSIESLADDVGRNQIFRTISRNDYFAGQKPLLWLGTDAFSTLRLGRLGKAGTTEQIKKICVDIHDYDFTGYHYWIITDADSDWNELVDELMILDSLKSMCKDSFHVLPNAPTVIPYPYTPVYNKRMKQKRYSRIVLKRILSIPEFPEFDYPLVLHEKPFDNYLYALVEPSAATSEKLVCDSKRFIELIRDSRFNDAIMECMRVLAFAILNTNNVKRLNELSAVRDCIVSYRSSMFGGRND